MKKFLGLYYEWGCDVKVSYAKMTMGKDVKKFIECYKKYTGDDSKVKKTGGAPGTNLSKSYL